MCSPRAYASCYHAGSMRRCSQGSAGLLLNAGPCWRRDLELAKFEAFLKNQNVLHIKANVRGRQRLAYPIKRWGRGTRAWEAAQRMWSLAYICSTERAAAIPCGRGLCTLRSSAVTSKVAVVFPKDAVPATAAAGCAGLHAATYSA